MKKTILIGLIGSILAVIPCQAKPKPFYKNPKFWVGEAIIGLSVALDAHSTCQSFAHGNVEVNFPAGNHSCKVTAGVLTGAFGFYSGLNMIEWHLGGNDPNKAWRTFAQWAMPSVAAGIHIPAAVHNYEIIEPRTTAAICTDPDRDCERRLDRD